MITDEEIEQLPEDPELAFVEFEKILLQRSREILDRASGQQDAEDCYLAYINKVLAAAREYKIDSLKKWDVPSVDSDQLYAAYRQLAANVDFFATQLRIRRAGRNRRNSVGLDGNTKAKIHQYIQKIRTVLNKFELPEPKRDALFSKLDAFALEVDRSRTNLQSVTDVYLTVCTAIGEGFNRLEPVRKFIDSIAALMGKAKETEDSLRALPAPTNQLEFSLKQLEPPDANGQPLDDEDIPS
jgi:hypothetical protein